MGKRAVSRLLGLLSKEDFRRNPVRALYRRLYWRWHWTFRAWHPFVVPFFGGTTIRLGPSSASYGIYLNDGFSDRDTANLFLEFLKPGMVAIDCDAHIGEYTVLFAVLVGPEGEVHAFEPDPRVFAILQDNITRNSLRNVWAHDKALGEVEGKAKFCLAEDPTASSFPQFASQIGKDVEVVITTLDAYTEEQGLSRVDAVKIDVEGAEGAVLAGARRVLTELWPGLIVIECHSENPIPLAKHLEIYGYKVCIRQDNAHRFAHIIARMDQ